MTRRISAVAVCCSSDSVSSALRACSSLNSRTFSIAMTAWSAKVFSSSTCFSGEWPRHSGHATTIAPIGVAVAQQRRPGCGATVPSPRHSVELLGSDDACRKLSRCLQSMARPLMSAGVGRHRERARRGCEGLPATSCGAGKMHRSPSNAEHAERYGLPPTAGRRSSRSPRTPVACRSASWLMTLRISLVAVCCSSACARSLLRA